MQSSRLRLSQELLDSVKERLLEPNPPAEGVVLARNISLESYQNFCKAEKNIPVKIRLVNGEVVAYEIPLGPHGTAAGTVAASIARWCDEVTCTAEEDINVAPNSYFTADYAFRPRRLPPPPVGQACNSLGWAFPNMVLEVGYSESIRSLHRWAPFYISGRTTIMIYLAIKIYPSNAMVAMLYQRTSQTPNIPTIVISFGWAPIHNRVVNFFVNIGVPGVNITGFGRPGAPPCNTANIPTYQLHIPAVEIFHRTPSILPSINFDLDLWKVQDRVLNP
ncbi:hypothetical protein C1646_771271 [Rhizophagus diaphanus]|nr:hypothetical protein C1646_771271 [Rhizophagus diaphanus] [Rhizophagus sp. MUCL 43196]